MRPGRDGGENESDSDHERNRNRFAIANHNTVVNNLQAENNRILESQLDAWLERQTILTSPWQVEIATVATIRSEPIAWVFFRRGWRQGKRATSYSQRPIIRLQREDPEEESAVLQVYTLGNSTQSSFVPYQRLLGISAITVRNGHHVEFEFKTRTPDTPRWENVGTPANNPQRLTCALQRAPPTATYGINDDETFTFGSVGNSGGYTESSTSDTTPESTETSRREKEDGTPPPN